MIQVPETFNNRRLRAYQVAGIDLVCNTFGHAMIGDVPGAGKTAQAIVAANLLEAKNVLVLCPPSLRINWAREFGMWSGTRFAVWEVPRAAAYRGPGLLPGPRVVIVPYSVVIGGDLAERLMSEAWDVVICDEFHQLKNPKSQRARACLGWTEKVEHETPDGRTKAKRVRHPGLVDRAKKLIAITGTPVPNGRAIEAQPLFAVIDPEGFGHFWSYVTKYTTREKTRFGYDFSTSKNLGELGRRARERFLIRRPKSEVFAEMPKLTRQTVYIEAPDVAERANAFRQDFQDAFDSGSAAAAPHISTMRAELGLAKVPEVAELISNLVNESGRVVVFAHHKAVIAALTAALDEAGHTFVTFTGETSAKEKQQAVDDFQAKKVEVFVGSITAASEGITLTAASTIVNIEPDWVPKTNEQAEGRCYRFGQTEPVRVFYPVVAGSIDEEITASVVEKQRNIDQILGES